MGLNERTVSAEFYRLAERQGLPPENLLPRRLQRYEVTLADALDLRPPEARELVRLSDEALASDALGTCQAIGDAAHYAQFEGILVPSATGVGEVLVVFADRLRSGSHVEAVDSETWAVPP